MIGTFDVDLISEFFRGFVNHALITLHIDNLRGVNAHHQAETIFPIRKDSRYQRDDQKV
jgi:imidazoleglycerol-phosphate dehydratase